ncbi:MAG TPA: RNA-protein complex protein Nop10 [Candidatus Bathyarchaeia archaeon]|nr:RNA-protein complex protein Nop10 [Candidatus Bathyarchaeia archaeon]
MKWLMRKCVKCTRYTLKTACPICGSTTRIPHPPKFSPADKYAKYRAESYGQTPEVQASGGSEAESG